MYSMVIIDFATDNAYQQILGPLSAIYIAALAIYTGDKEFNRWSDYHDSQHPGEMFVIGWTILLILIILADIVFMKPYKMPGEVTSTYIAVLSILAITQKSKNLYSKKRKR